MIPHFGKPIELVTWADLERLTATPPASEDLTMEFKGVLEKNPRVTQPAWTFDTIEKFRDDIAAEVIAFANALGGLIIIGMDDLKPAAGGAGQATTLQPFAHPASNAESWQRSLSQRIYPLPSLQMRGIEREPGWGVVIVYVNASPLFRPHGLGSKAWVRRGESTAQMTVAEIRDMTLAAARGLDALEAGLDADLKIWGEQTRSGPGRVHFSLYCQVRPLGEFPVSRFAMNPPIKIGRNIPLTIALGRSGRAILEVPPNGNDRWTPILRGAAIGTSRHEPSLESWQRMAMLNGAAMTFLSQSREEGEKTLTIYAESVLATMVEAIDIAFQLQEREGRGDVESVAQWACFAKGSHQVLTVDNRSVGKDVLVPDVQSSPRYRFRNPTEAQTALANMEADFWNALGVEKPQPAAVSVDWDRLRKL